MPLPLPFLLPNFPLPVLPGCCFTVSVADFYVTHIIVVIFTFHHFIQFVLLDGDVRRPFYSTVSERFVYMSCVFALFFFCSQYFNPLSGDAVSNREKRLLQA